MVPKLNESRKTMCFKSYIFTSNCKISLIKYVINVYFLNVLQFACNKKKFQKLCKWSLRIGHTYLTHGPLLRWETPPQCSACQIELTVEHIVLNCSCFTNAQMLNSLWQAYDALCYNRNDSYGWISGTLIATDCAKLVINFHVRNIDVLLSWEPAEKAYFCPVSTDFFICFCSQLHDQITCRLLSIVVIDIEVFWFLFEVVLLVLNLMFY